MIMATMVGLLTAAGVYFLFLGGFIRMTFGFVLLGHAVNLMLLAAGVGFYRDPAFVGEGDSASFADPVPQAFVLTAIVITFAVTIYLLGMLARKLHLLREGPDAPTGAYDAEYQAAHHRRVSGKSAPVATAHNEGGDVV